MSDNIKTWQEQIESAARAMALHAGWDKWDAATSCTDTLSGNDPDDEREYYRELAQVALATTAHTVAVDKNGLLPCPFCGGTAKPHDISGWEIYCENSDCGAHMVLMSPYKAPLISAWNCRANLSEGVAIPEGWQKLDRAGQIKKGDKLRFICAGRKSTETAKLILNAGTDKEEIVYNKRQNFYFITSMAIAGTSSHKDVEVLAAAPSPEQQLKGGA